MLRKFNYTDRKKIQKSEALFSIHDNGTFKEFDVILDLEVSDYPENASLYIEAYHKETRQRYSFGTLATQKPPSNRLLQEIDLSGETLFKILIVDESDAHGKILGFGKGFKAGGDDPSDSKSLLAVEVKDLGQEVWKVEFNDDGEPELHLDIKVPNAINRINEDRLFQSMIIPPAFRQILMGYLWNFEDDENEIKEKWMTLAQRFGGRLPHPDDDFIDKMKWIDEVIESFSKQHKFCENLVTKLEEMS